MSIPETGVVIENGVNFLTIKDYSFDYNVDESFCALDLR